MQKYILRAKDKMIMQNEGENHKGDKKVHLEVEFEVNDVG